MSYAAHRLCLMGLMLFGLAGCGGPAPAIDVINSMPLPEAFEKGLRARDVQLDRGGQSVILYDLSLVEDDGPGACASREYGPAAPTTIRGDVKVKKILHLDRAEALDARLVLSVAPRSGETAPLLGSINGRQFGISVIQFRTDAEEWPVIRLPEGVLVEGDNTVILSCAGEQGWSITVAQRRLILRNDPSRRDRPNRSFRSVDAGRTWAARLGDDGRQDGELMVRLHLIQYAEHGELVGPIIDLAALSGGTELVPQVRVDSVRLRQRSSLPEGTAVELAIRSGDTPVFDPACWSDWRNAAGDVRRDLKRFVQWRAVLSTRRPTATPLLRAVDVEARVRPRRPAWLANVKLRDSHNEQIVYTSLPFEYEKFDEPQLVELRSRYKLDEVVAGAKTELEKIIRLRDWVSAQWKYAPPVADYPAWDAREILRQRKGFCVQYGIVNMQCALSLGLQARFVFGHFPNVTVEGSPTCGHEVTEVWSNELGKWIVMDANLNECFVSRRSGEPASMLELHEDQLDGYFLHGFDAAGAVFEKLRPSEGMLRWKGLEAGPRPEKPILEPKWGYLQWMPRNNFYAHRFPEPLLQGHTWSWTGYWNWEDARTPRQWRYGRNTHRRSDINWTINQVRWAAAPAEQPGTIRLIMGTVTPDFDAFLVSCDNGPWRATTARLDWPLHAGKNRMEMRVRNRAGVLGPKSWIDVDYE